MQVKEWLLILVGLQVFLRIHYLIGVPGLGIKELSDMYNVYIYIYIYRYIYIHIYSLFFWRYNCIVGCIYKYIEMHRAFFYLDTYMYRSKLLDMCTCTWLHM